jgi:hypothetical protein
MTECVTLLSWLHDSLKAAANRPAVHQVEAVSNRWRFAKCDFQDAVERSVTINDQPKHETYKPILAWARN